MPSLPRNWHLVTAARQCDWQKTRNRTRLKCCACHAKWDQRCPKCCACYVTKKETHLWKTWRKYCACHTKRLLTRHETCSHVTKCHATQNDITFNKDGFCSFPHRHCDGTTEASESTFSYEFSYEPASKSTFRARLPSICHDMSQNATPATQLALCHRCATVRLAKNTQHDTSKVLRLPRKMKSEVSKVLRLLRKRKRIFGKRGESIAPATQNDFWHVLKHARMSQSATPRRWECHEKWSYATPESSKRDPLLQNFLQARPYGSHADTCERFADGCERWRT